MRTGSSFILPDDRVCVYGWCGVVKLGCVREEGETDWAICVSVNGTRTSRDSQVPRDRPPLLLVRRSQGREPVRTGGSLGILKQHRGESVKEKKQLW